MYASERVLKWVMRLYPPLLFQRIWVKKFEKDFKGVQVKIFKSILNINYNRSIFGGTIYGAADPFYAVLFYQALLRRGYKTLIWQKAAEIDYIKPGTSCLYFSISLTDDDISEACRILDEEGKFVKAFPIEIKDSNENVCARITSIVYVKSLHLKNEESF